MQKTITSPKLRLVRQKFKKNDKHEKFQHFRLHNYQKNFSLPVIGPHGALVGLQNPIKCL